MGVARVAEAVGKGLAAGLVGTAAMTVSSTVEMRLTGREISTVPAEAFAALMRVKPQDDEAKRRLNSLAHWSYGVAQGAVRGLIAAVGLSGPTATAAHFVWVYGSQQAALPALGVAEPSWRYGFKAFATDIWHHAVYAVVTGFVYDWLDRRR